MARWWEAEPGLGPAEGVGAGPAVGGAGGPWRPRRGPGERRPPSLLCGSEQAPRGGPARPSSPNPPISPAGGSRALRRRPAAPRPGPAEAVRARAGAAAVPSPSPGPGAGECFPGSRLPQTGPRASGTATPAGSWERRGGGLGCRGPSPAAGVLGRPGRGWGEMDGPARPVGSAAEDARPSSFFSLALGDAGLRSPGPFFLEPRVLSTAFPLAGVETMVTKAAVTSQALQVNVRY